MTHTGQGCEQIKLPECAIGDYALPIRSWVLYAFHHQDRGREWQAASHGVEKYIGPVPCACLQQFVSEPFMLERTRLQYMRNFAVVCLDLVRAILPVHDSPGLIEAHGQRRLGGKAVEARFRFPFACSPPTYP